MNAEASHQSAYSLSGGGFVIGPIFAQHLSIALRLTGEQTGLVSLILRHALSGGGLKDMPEAVAQVIGREAGYIRRLMSTLPAGLVAADAATFNGFVAPLLRRIAVAMAHHYRPLPLGELSDESAITRLQRTARRSQPGRARILILSGFLGSGKTTLLAALLGNPRLAQSLCIVNEIGAAAIDHITLSMVKGLDDISLMPGGCLCCAFEHELVACLRQAAQSACGAPDVVIETSGVADPLAIASTILSDAELRQVYEFAGICVTANAFDGIATIDTRNGACQIAGADWIVATKTDLVDAFDLTSFLRELRARNATAQIMPSRLGALPVDEIVAAIYDASHERKTAGAARGSAVPHEHDKVTAVAIYPEAADSVDAARLFCDVAMFAKADELLRVKGILNGTRNSILVNSVRTAFHEIAILPAITDPVLTLIGPNLDQTGVERLWETLRAAVAKKPY